MEETLKVIKEDNLSRLQVQTLRFTDNIADMKK